MITARITNWNNCIEVYSLSLTFSELMSWHLSTSPQEIIAPQSHQREFWWSDATKSRFIESILIDFPLPEILLLQDIRGVGILEIVDGWQRLNSVIQFVNPDALNLPPLVLTGCDLAPELNGILYKTLERILQTKIKRSSNKVVILQWKREMQEDRAILRNHLIDRLRSTQK